MEMEASWVPASRGYIPNGAAVGCTNYHGPICIGRAKHNGNTLPGKVLAGLHCTVSWQGKAVTKDEYEVLCFAGEVWQFMSPGSPLPQGALPVGFTKHEGVLFVGRIHNQKGVTVIGRVPSSDIKCYAYINAEKKEIACPEFEILTVPPAAYHALAMPKIKPPFRNQMPENNFGNNNIQPNFSATNNMPYPNLANPFPLQHFSNGNNIPQMPPFPNFGTANVSSQRQTPHTGIPPYQNKKHNPNNGAARKNNFKGKNQNQNNNNNFKKAMQNNTGSQDQEKKCPQMQENLQSKRVTASIPPKSVNLNELLGAPKIPLVNRVQHKQDRQPAMVTTDGNLQQHEIPKQKKPKFKKKKNVPKSQTPGKSFEKPKQDVECAHLAEVSSLSLECLDRSSACEKCDNEGGDNWECLHCRKVLCRGSDQHMMAHALQSSHVVVISQENLSVWCFKCDMFLGAQVKMKALQKGLIDDKQNKSQHLTTRTTTERKPSPKYEVSSETVQTNPQKPAVTDIPNKDENKLSKPLSMPVTEYKNKDPYELPKQVTTVTPYKLQEPPQWVLDMFKSPVVNGSMQTKEFPSNTQFVPIPIPVAIPGQNLPIVNNSKGIGEAKTATVAKKKPCWVSSSNSIVPAGALSGGKNNQGDVYVARVKQDGAVIPGKFVPNYSGCYASNKGREILDREFEVLCHVEAEWVKMETALPVKTVQGGFDEDHKPLYIGRAKQPDNSVVLGKVEEIDGEYKLIYLLSRKEYECTEFEILVSSEIVPVKGSSEIEKEQELTYSKKIPLPKAVLLPRTPEARGITTLQNINWVTARDGNVPSGAVAGGSNHKGEVYVARAENNGEIIPGKLIPSYRRCYIAANGEEVQKREYQVLCEANTSWYSFLPGEDIPNTAIPAGQSGSQIFYIGRVLSGGRVTIGKVDARSKMCIAVQSGKEIEFNVFDILVSTLHDARSLNKIAEKLPTELANLALSLRESRPPASITQKTDIAATPRLRKRESEFRLQALESSDEDYKYVSEKMQRSIVSHRGLFGGGNFKSYVIHKIERIHNSVVWDRYRHMCKKIKKENNDELNEKKLFHGSAICPDIAKSGFDERHSKPGGMFGAGVYFAEHSSKSNQYTQSSGYMLLCRVALGKVAEHTTSVKYAHAPPEHHSVKGVPSPNGLLYPEYIIYRGEQAFPAYLIQYKTSN